MQYPRPAHLSSVRTNLCHLTRNLFNELCSIFMRWTSASRLIVKGLACGTAVDLKLISRGVLRDYGQAPLPFSLVLIRPNSTSELSLDCQMCVAQIRIPTRRPGNPIDHQRTGSRSMASHGCAQVCFAAAPVDRRGNRGIQCRNNKLEDAPFRRSACPAGGRCCWPPSLWRSQQSRVPRGCTRRGRGRRCNRRRKLSAREPRNPSRRH